MTGLADSVLRKLGYGVLAASMVASGPAFAQSASGNTSQNQSTAQQPSSSQDGWQNFSGGWSNQKAASPRASVAPAPSPTAAVQVQQATDLNAENDTQDGSQNAQQNVPPVAPNNSQGPGWQLTIPSGTYLTVRIQEPLSSDRNKEGDSFSATLVQPVIADGVVVAQRGQTVGGRVTEAKKAGRVSGTSELKLELTGLTLVDGQMVPIESRLVRLSAGSSKGRDAAAIAGTTGFGAAVGAAAAWGTGAAIGAGAGLVASTIGVLVTRGRPTVLYPETELTFQVSAPVSVDTERSPQSFRAANSSDYPQSPSRESGNYATNYCNAYGCPGPYPYYANYGPYYYPYPYYWGPGYYYGPGVFIGYRGGFRRGFHR